MKTIIISKVVETSRVKKSAQPINALIVVDVQNCFINGNLSLSKSPAGQDGAEVIPIINNLIRTIPFDVIVYTQDWHPWNHISFFENLHFRRQYLAGDQNQTIKMFDKVTYLGPKYKMEQVLWPTHCIQETEDAALHKDLDVISSSSRVIHIRKGIDPDIDSYSAFADNYGVRKTELHDKLKERNVTQVFIAGLATDYCVTSTALDAFDLNYITYVVKDASRGVTLSTIKSQLKKLKQHGVHIITTNNSSKYKKTSSDEIFV
ncbi:unnamed protein product [Rotaria sordida]|uniref:nicotinamidase n=1 Tax=Rotaria sordida TaxID=392033 RepID=A0A815GJY8_9BILA|nr:unnamed protein product [Rotaria sordida]